MLIVKLSRFIEKAAVRNKLLLGLLSIYYRDLVKREVKLAQLSPDDKILCIGGGKCPLTAILIHKYSGAHVTVIDNDISCVNRANECIHLNCLSNINVKYDDGNKIDPADYNVIHLAMQVYPMQDVLEHIIQKSNQNTKILVRKPKKKIGALYSNFKINTDLDEKKIKHNVFVNAAFTFLYYKKPIVVNRL